MSAHTPGPWEVSRGKIAGVELSHTVVLTGRDAVAVFAGSADAGEANARLIAAAPELLAALRGIIEIGKRDLSNPKYDGYFEEARTAIAKAEGES